MAASDFSEWELAIRRGIPPGPLPPPRSMPGQFVGVLLPETTTSEMAAAIVVEMDWCDEENSMSYIYRPPFSVGDRVLFPLSTYSRPPLIDGYVVVPVHTVVAWTPA